MSTTPRPIRASKARRRAATRAVSTERPIPGNSATAVHTPSGGGTAAGRVCATREAGAAAARTTTNAASKIDRMGSEAIARVCARQLDAASANQANYAMTFPSTLEARVAELERERKHLLAVIEILKEVSRSLHFIDILQAIARKLGEAFGLDRCSIFLAERGGRSVRLVASYEDPTIRNYVVDLERYPELKRAMQGGETVFIPDAATDPSLSTRPAIRCAGWSSSGWRSCRSCGACSRRSASARARGPKASCPAPRPTSSTGWSASPWPSFKKKPKVGEGPIPGRPRRRAPAAAGACQPRVLRTGQARDLRRRVRPRVSRAAGPRNAASRAPDPRQPHPPHRRRAGRQVPQAPPSGAHAVARERLQRDGTRGVGGAERPAGPGGPEGGIHARGEDRRRGREPHLPRRRLHGRRDPGQRHRGRGRDGQPAHDRRHPPASQGEGQDLAQAHGGARRGVFLEVALRRAQP